MRTINNMEDIIDSRDIIERIEELETEWEELKEEDKTELTEWEESNLEELETLKSLAEEASCSPDWEYGEALIRYSYFTEYTQDLCVDTGEIPASLPWYIENHIDWDGVAREIKADYMEVDFDGVEYLIRA